SQSLSDFESFHRLSSFCDDVDETGSARHILSSIPLSYQFKFLSVFGSSPSVVAEVFKLRSFCFVSSYRESINPYWDDSRVKHPILFCLVQLAWNFVSSGLKAKTRVDLEKRRAEKERAEKGHVPSGYFLPLTFKVFQLAAYPPFPASDMGWGKELGQMLSVSLCNLFDATDLLYNDVKYERVLFYLNGFNELIPKEVTIRWKRH
ncbi:hypothetical protein Prudu_009124, partial [Prunus dulcis]